MSKLSSTITIGTKGELEYPCLKIGNGSGNVALFSSPTLGVYITGIHKAKVVDTDDILGNFKAFIGSITLTQE